MGIKDHFSFIFGHSLNILCPSLPPSTPRFALSFLSCLFISIKIDIRMLHKLSQIVFFITKIGNLMIFIVSSLENYYQLMKIMIVLLLFVFCLLNNSNSFFFLLFFHCLNPNYGSSKID